MTEPPATPESTPGVPPGVTPYLLVMPPSVEAGVPTVAWPGPEGRPAWAIPVMIPEGTRGYAVFIPLQPSAAPMAGEPVALEPDAADPMALEPGAAAGPEPVDPAAAEPVAVDPVRDGRAAVPAATPPPEPVPVRSISRTDEASVAALVAPARAGRPPYGGPPRSTFLADNWPGPAPRRGWTAPLAVVTAGLGAAIFTPLGRTGIGWLLAGLALSAVVAIAVWRTVAGQPRPQRWMRIAWTVAALALLAVPAVRNAWWLVTFCVLGALACFALAIIDGRMVRSMLYSLVAAPFAALRGIPWVARQLPARGRDGTPAATLRRVVWSVLATALVLVVFGALLTSADAVFSSILRDHPPSVDAGIVINRTLLWVLGALTAVAAVYTICAPPRLAGLDRTGTARLGLIEWALPITGLVALFGAFVGVQFTVLFGGQRHVLTTAGLSYADYARSGFWQLVVVTVLTLAVLAGVTRWARRERPAERARCGCSWACSAHCRS